MRTMLMAAGAVVALAAPGLARAETACADLKTTRLAHAEVTAASVESQGGRELCKVAVTSRPTPDSDIRIEVWIPLGAGWNGKFVQLGNGGFAGTVPSGRLKQVAGQGYATAGTDNGHQDPVGTSAAWALGKTEKIVDYGWRSLKETTDIAKALIRAQKADGPKTSYFYGCSDGGREALMEAQRFPADFDGIIAGAPANYMSRLFGNGAAQQQALAKPGAYLDKPALELIQAAALKDCGGEAFVRDPLACRFDPAALLCKPGVTACLTAPQVAAAKAIYDGRRDPRNGKVVLPGLSPGGEAQGGGWQAWVTGPSQDRNANAAGYQFASNAFKYFAFQDPNYDFLTMDLGAEFDRAKAKMSPMIDAESPDLKAFKARGGKLIQYHGWNDAAIPARSSIVYYEDVGRTMGDTSGFYRMYLIPGMLHCGGGAGPSTVDWLATLDDWVVGGTAPASLTATSVVNGRQLLCPYPAVAKADGKGGWACPVVKPKG
ncbi:MAG: tannase/feruloyl esterase family alpha/beta hydrolase [Alphaproteobacteria bacterium]|nr:tannase/feruloyl esterase family alpha/beta hydrolase [Alphaproteobacteria bacterium]MBU1512528.1 tannase/feruloyl esterase family alpha/beta hydrolase [Alphaproteobacteria bacterium]MBU2092867.1 tannase/feruloyl esterase family alpha/beta hydrolase [Alphaproteobacteria bacterium]MBU2150894.1 tannase/feruloyl esterase family alpha/beta hydrolase [Alphaproteobacteria bacterium]MBU2307895.1 tannase/feruloyl esterase family alpha/beta hydrolase [Alphaproteobacteria bacterium]